MSQDAETALYIVWDGVIASIIFSMSTLAFNSKKKKKNEKKLMEYEVIFQITFFFRYISFELKLARNFICYVNTLKPPPFF